MNGKIIVVTHKDYGMPKDSLYLPVCVGAKIPMLKHRFQPDNEGENISEKNPTYCELTAIYWAWKNLTDKNLDYIGIVHYRRYFSEKKQTVSASDILTRQQLESLMEKEQGNVIFAPPKRRYLSSVQKHYIRSLKGYQEVHKRDIERLKKAIHECTPEYDIQAEKVLNSHSAHMLNMFIMSAEHFQEYCEWLFPVIEKVVEQSSDREDQRRYAGALSEFCLDIWSRKNQIAIRELPLFETEHKTFGRKVFDYIKRKI